MSDSQTRLGAMLAVAEFPFMGIVFSELGDTLG